jgi:hypothetical protein
MFVDGVMGRNFFSSPPYHGVRFPVVALFASTVRRLNTKSKKKHHVVFVWPDCGKYFHAPPNNHSSQALSHSPSLHSLPIAAYRHPTPANVHGTASLPCPPSQASQVHVSPPDAALDI